MITKPATVAIYELKKGIIDTINNSGLPAEVIKYVLADIANSLNELAQQQLQEDMRIYQENLAKEKDDAED